MPTSPADLESLPFGALQDGSRATVYVLRQGDISAHVTDFGATLVSLMVPDREGQPADVVLGFDDVSGYESEDNQYFGCTAGRVANRIGGASFELDGERHELVANDGRNQLHGGAVGFGRRLWEVIDQGSTPHLSFVRMGYVSPDGEEGFPGTLRAEVTYTLDDRGELAFEYRATSDQATPVNLTNHAYWNLAGQGAPTVLDHELLVHAERITVADDELIPTGQLAPVAGTPLDFRRSQGVGARIQPLDGTAAKGYDHNFVLDGHPGDATPKELHRAARLVHKASGRAMDVWTNMPGLQVYSGNFLFGQVGKGGARYAHRSALCLEAQHFPDSVHHGNFPSTILRPGETYVQRTAHRFSICD